VQIPGAWVKSGYSGTAIVDPETDEVVRLTVKTAELPDASSVCEISNDLKLKMTKIGDGEILLPIEAREKFVVTDGEEIENTTSFDECREYVGESRLSFDPPEPDRPRPVESGGSAPVRVLPNQRFTLEVTAPIASVTAAAGDSFTARLLTSLRDERRRTLAPKGSLLRGHLLRVERHHLAPASTIVVLQPENLEIADSEVPFMAVRDLSRELGGKQKGKTRIEIPLPLPSEKNAGVFRFDGDQVEVPRGYRSDWRTVDAGRR